MFQLSCSSSCIANLNTIFKVQQSLFESLRQKFIHQKQLLQRGSANRHHFPKGFTFLRLVVSLWHNCQKSASRRQVKSLGLEQLNSDKHHQLLATRLEPSCINPPRGKNAPKNALFLYQWRCFIPENLQVESSTFLSTSEGLIIKQYTKKIHWKIHWKENPHQSWAMNLKWILQGEHWNYNFAAYQVEAFSHIRLDRLPCLERCSTGFPCFPAIFGIKWLERTESHLHCFLPAKTPGAFLSSPGRMIVHQYQTQRLMQKMIIWAPPKCQNRTHPGLAVLRWKQNVCEGPARAALATENRWVKAGKRCKQVSKLQSMVKSLTSRSMRLSTSQVMLSKPPLDIIGLQPVLSICMQIKHECPSLQWFANPTNCVLDSNFSWPPSTVRTCTSHQKKSQNQSDPINNSNSKANLDPIASSLQCWYTSTSSSRITCIPQAPAQEWRRCFTSCRKATIETACSEHSALQGCHCAIAAH